MKKPIFLKLFISYLFLILALSGLILAFVFKSYSSHAVETSTESLSKIGRSLQYVVKPLIEQGRTDELEPLLKNIETDIGVRLTLIDADGVVLADSEHSAKSMDNHALRPEVRTALSGTPGSFVRYSTTLKRDMLYVALPINSPGGQRSVIRLSVPLVRVDPLLDTMKKHTAELMITCVAFSLLLALLFSHLISTPIRELNRASKRLAKGDFKARVTLNGRDEIQELSESFNDMAEKLEHSFAQLSHGKEELEGIISSMGEGLLVIDSQGKVMLANRSAESLIGIEGVLSRHYWEIIRSPHLNRIIDTAVDTPISEELELSGKFYLVSITPIHSGKAKVIVLHDITEMKKLEMIKKELVVNVSHELRTPLTAIKGFTETLIEENPESGQEYLDIIKRHTDRLINIIGDLLDLSELEAREVRMASEDVQVKPLIEGVLAMFGPRFASKGLHFSIYEKPEGISVKGDPFRLEQLFTNLIDNALKYTEQGSVTIAIERSAGSAIIKITDTGIGIPKEHLDRIFERFYVVDKSRSRRLGGTGLGLAIVKHIVGLHKGSITVSSKPSAGTSFTITLPLAA